jgi:hypothetical protein
VVPVSSGPIEFLGEEPGHEVAATEFTGSDGLIQPSPREVGLKARVDGMEIGHELTASEVSAVSGRAARVPLNYREAGTGESDTGDLVVDPLTGRVFTEEDQKTSKDVTGKPARDHALGEGQWQ